MNKDIENVKIGSNSKFRLLGCKECKGKQNKTNIGNPEDENNSMEKSYSFLTLKPIIYLANIKESELGNPDNEYVKLVKDYASKENARVVSLCAKVEEELSELNEAEELQGVTE